MTFESGLVLLVIVLMLVALYFEILGTSLIFFIVVMIFYFFNFISLSNILLCLANEQIILIFLLFILSDIIKKTQWIDSFMNFFFHFRLRYHQFLLRMGASVTLLSSVMNNTPLVALAIPYISTWASKRRIAPSKIMIPLSFFTIVGGTITLIGTSTNLILNGLITNHNLTPLRLTDFTLNGLLNALICLGFMMLLGYWLLPKRKNAIEEFQEKKRTYVIQTKVPEGSTFIGKTIAQANLRNLRGLFLVEIIRNTKIIAPVNSNETILQDDLLVFAGDTETVNDLLKNKNDLILTPSDDNTWMNNENIEIIEAVISPKSSLIGEKPKYINFRQKYDAAIIAIHRNGEKLSGKIGENILNEGDLLMLAPGKGFYSYNETLEDLYVISKTSKMGILAKEKKWIILLSLIAVIFLAVLKIIPLVVGLMCMVGITAALKILKGNDVKKSFDINLYLVLAFSLAIGKSIEISGAAGQVAEVFLNFLPYHPLVILAGIYLFTNILTNIVTNAAAIAIAFPITFSLANHLGIKDYTPFFLAIAYASSYAFMTPYGYQTNLMVYGPGNYKFKDFIKIGLPLSLLLMASTVLFLYFLYF